jgi:hypothetical protein
MRVRPIGSCTAVSRMLAQLSGCSSGGSTAPANTGSTGKTPTTTTANVPIQGTLSADGTSVTGTHLPAGVAGSGTFQGSTASCVTAGATSVAGLWVTNGTGLSTNLRVALTQSGGSTGGFWYGTLSFTGTVTAGTAGTGSTMTGTVVFTPPRTMTQTFSQQTVTGVTLTRY